MGENLRPKGKLSSLGSERLFPALSNARQMPMDDIFDQKEVPFLFFMENI